MDRSAREITVEPDDESRPAKDEAATTSVPEPTAYAVSRFNASKHGILSKETVLPWEDGAEYYKMYADLVEEHQPQGPTEAHLVEELAGIIWRKRRLRVAEAGIIRRGMHASIEELRQSVFAPYSQDPTIGAALVDQEDGEIGGEAQQYLVDAVQVPEEAVTADFERMPIIIESIKKALALLATKKPSRYKRALEVLQPETCEWWQDQTEDDLFELESKMASKDESGSSAAEHEMQESALYERTPDDLERWLERQQIPFYEAQLAAFGRRQALRKQVFADAIEPDRFDKLGRYEAHLDRKFEKTLAMLIRLQDIRRLRKVD